MTVTFRFYGPLNDFLPQHQRQRSFDWSVRQHSTIKDIIESLGVPHPEIDLLLVNSLPIDFTYRMQPDDLCSIYPTFHTLDVSTLSRQSTSPLVPFRFVLDTHLGKLAVYLRLLGFDTLYRNTSTDQELAQISAQENRVLLTRDRGLLMRSMVQYGYFVRSTQPAQQIREVIQRYGLERQQVPFSRCLVCNGELAPVAKEAILDHLPPNVRTHQHSFLRCVDCRKVFWEGTHYQRMLEFIKALVQTT